MKKELTVFDILDLIIRKKKTFIYIGLITIVVSGVIAFLLPVYYKSTCVLYPFNPEAYDPRNINKATNPYGSVMDGDRIVALAESRDVKDLIIEKYNLIDRYDIDRDDELAEVKVREEMTGNLVVKENELSAIEISFYDTDADTAAMIVNDIIIIVDEMNKRPLIEISQKIFESYEKLIAEKYDGIDSLQKIIDNVDFKGNFTRSEIISTELLHTIIELKTARKSLELIKQDFSTVNIIERAEAIPKKAKPKRLFIIAGTLVVTMTITFLVLLLKEFSILSFTKEKDQAE